MRELCKQVIGSVGSVVLAASPASATNTREPLNFTFTPDGHYSSFSGTTAHEMMPTPEFREYMQALKNMKCEIAGDILNSAFIRQYPRFERARRKQNNKYNLDYNAWRMYAEGFFDEFGYCVIMSDMDRIEKLLRKAKAKPAKYAMQRRLRHPEKTYSDPLLYRRDLRLSMLIGKAEIGFVPALLKLVTLVRRGEAFKHNVETEYYLLKRACFLGHDCATLERHLQRLAQQIAPGRAAHSARQARRRIPHIETILKGAKL